MASGMNGNFDHFQLVNCDQDTRNTIVIYISRVIDRETHFSVISCPSRLHLLLLFLLLQLLICI